MIKRNGESRTDLRQRRVGFGTSLDLSRITGHKVKRREPRTEKGREFQETLFNLLETDDDHHKGGADLYKVRRRATIRMASSRCESENIKM